MQDAGHFHDGRLFLPLRKSSGLLLIHVGASEPLSVLVKHNDLPVMVLSPPVFLEIRMLPDCHLKEYITLNILSTNELSTLSVANEA